MPVLLHRYRLDVALALLGDEKSTLIGPIVGGCRQGSKRRFVECEIEMGTWKVGCNYL